MVHLSSLFSSGYLFQRNREAVFFLESEAAPSFLLVNKTKGLSIEPVRVIHEGKGFVVAFPPQEGSFDVYFLRVLEGLSACEFGPYHCGDLFLCVGQSNFSITTSLMENSASIKEKADSSSCYILSLFDEDVSEEGHVNRPFLKQKETNPEAKWERLTSEVAEHSAALPCMIAELLSEKRPYPIGIVSTSVGGISIDAFLPSEAIEGEEALKSYLMKSGKWPREKDWNKKGMANYTQTSGFFNEKIAPLKGISFAAVLYYQGENSCLDYESGVFFKRALEALISSYRAYFSDEELPFFFCGIADEYYPYGDRFGLFYIQEALASLEVKSATYIPVFDIDPRWLVKDGKQYYHPIHTVNKLPLAERFAFCIERNLHEGESFHYPRFRRAYEENGRLIVELDLYEDSLNVGDSYFGFTLAEEDGDFFLCEAKAVGESLIALSSPYINRPSRFAFAFTHYSYLCSCLTKKGYPLSPCRNFTSPVDPSSFDLDFIASSCRHLSLRENNFGASVGGGMEMPLFEVGRYVNSREGKIEKAGEGEIEASFSFDNDSYYYASLGFNLGLSGLFHRLGSHNRMSLEIRSSEPLSFLGALFRANGGIYRFPSLRQETGREWATFVLALDRIQDGSEGYASLSKEVVSSLPRIEFEFHAEKECKAKIRLRNIRVYQEEEGRDAQEEKKSAKDLSLQLPGGN